MRIDPDDFYKPMPDPQQTTVGHDAETGEGLAVVMDGWEYISYRQIRHMLYHSRCRNVNFGGKEKDG